ncbi:MAG: DUF255 domain-containing protein [Candidatus Rhabdochlamydia sp.]
MTDISPKIEWRAWDETTFWQAQDRCKLIFLSITYATCHWCHRMQDEVFSHPEVIDTLNTHFIPIQIDKDMYPDVNLFYMRCSQLWLQEKTGWPLHLILTPDLTPITAFTYLSIQDCLKRLEEAYQQEKGGNHRLIQSDSFLQLQENRVSCHEEIPSMADLESGVELFLKIADFEYGGMKRVVKFPLGFHLEFLLRWASQNNHQQLLDYVINTLNMIQERGIHDLIGSGFFRYCTDEEWITPHFEKTLYDNAILARLFLQAGAVFPLTSYQATGYQTLDYLLTSLQMPEGCFCSGEDSTIETEKNSFYTWTYTEIRELVSEEEASFFCSYCNIPLGIDSQDRHVPWMDMQVKDFARGHGISLETMKACLEKVRGVLFKKRLQKQSPLRHKLIITGYNGLAIDALALGQGVYLTAAIRASAFIWDHLFYEGKLFHAWEEGRRHGEGVLEDYACFIKGLLTLFEVTNITLYLDRALELTQILKQNFKLENGAFYQTAHHQQRLMKMCTFEDDAYPCGNSVHAENLVRLYQITQDITFKQQAEDIFQSGAHLLKKFAPLCFYHMSALLDYLHIKTEKL